MTTKTYTIVIKDGADILYAAQHSGVGWMDAAGQRGRLSEARKDEAMTEVLAAGVPYDLIEHDGESAGGRRIGGTAKLYDGRLS